MKPYGADDGVDIIHAVDTLTKCEYIVYVGHWKYD